MKHPELKQWRALAALDLSSKGQEWGWVLMIAGAKMGRPPAGEKPLPELQNRAGRDCCPSSVSAAHGQTQQRARSLVTPAQGSALWAGSRAEEWAI